MKEGGWWKFSPWQSFVLKKHLLLKQLLSSLKMSELEIFLWLTQAPNTLMQIFRNKGATKKASRKAIFYPKMVTPPKQIISHKSVHWYQCISLWKMLDGECLVHDKEKVLFLKTHFFLLKKCSIFFKKCPKQIFVVNPSPKYVQAHI